MRTDRPEPVSCASFILESFMLPQRELGDTKIQVSPICFGSLTMTSMQKNLTIREGAELLAYGFERGINFVDTAQYYENYAYIREALRTIPRDRYVITTKSYAYDIHTARAALDEALQSLHTDYIDLFLLHEQESIHTLRGHAEALDYFVEQKNKGVIRAIGLSTHRISGVEAALTKDTIEVIHPIFNEKGIGIQDGSVAEMESLLRVAHKRGKGIYAMKALGGGHLIPTYAQSLSFVLEKPFFHSVAIGMQSKAEIDCNIALALGARDEMLEESLRRQTRRLLVADHCIGCGACEKTCRQDAIHVIDGMATPNERCILCGYCAISCPEFCIKVI